jgi:hypothetical protein
LQSDIAKEEVWRYAALSNALAEPHSALLRAGIAPGDLCVILGGGLRAACAALVLGALGAQSMVLCSDEASLTGLMAAPFSVGAAIDSRGLDPDGGRQAIAEQAAAWDIGPHGFFLLETSGTDGGRARALSMATAADVVILLDREARSAADGMAAPVPAGPALGGVFALDRIATQGCTILGAGPPHPDLLPELLALTLRAALDLKVLCRPVTPQEIDGILAERRRGSLAPLTLPIVIYSS